MVPCIRTAGTEPRADSLGWSEHRVMITGYNTDVRYGGIVLHVQTEDKGQGNPYIESLVYHGGQVVAAKRHSYAKVLESGGGDDAIMSLMDRQHRALIEAIKRGHFDEQIRSIVGDTSPSSEQVTADIELASDNGRSLDQVILEYLSAEAEQEQLLLSLENEIDLRPGLRVRLSLRACSSKSGQPIAGAKVNARLISTNSGPRTLAVGETDNDGCLELAFEVPKVARGTSALILYGASEIGQAQIKHVL